VSRIIDEKAQGDVSRERALLAAIPQAKAGRGDKDTRIIGWQLFWIRGETNNSRFRVFPLTHVLSLPRSKIVLILPKNFTRSLTWKSSYTP
jgi:hypothetical protein